MTPYEYMPTRAVELSQLAAEEEPPPTAIDVVRATSHLQMDGAVPPSQHNAGVTALACSVVLACGLVSASKLSGWKSLQNDPLVIVCVTQSDLRTGAALGLCSWATSVAILGSRMVSSFRFHRACYRYEPGKTATFKVLGASYAAHILLFVNTIGWWVQLNEVFMLVGGPVCRPNAGISIFSQLAAFMAMGTLASLLTAPLVMYALDAEEEQKVHADSAAVCLFCRNALNQASGQAMLSSAELAFALSCESRDRLHKMRLLLERLPLNRRRNVVREHIILALLTLALGIGADGQLISLERMYGLVLPESLGSIAPFFCELTCANADSVERKLTAAISMSFISFAITLLAVVRAMLNSLGCCRFVAASCCACPPGKPNYCCLITAYSISMGFLAVASFCWSLSWAALLSSNVSFMSASLPLGLPYCKAFIKAHCLQHSGHTVRTVLILPTGFGFTASVCASLAVACMMPTLLSAQPAIREILSIRDIPAITPLCSRCCPDTFLGALQEPDRMPDNAPSQMEAPQRDDSYLHMLAERRRLMLLKLLAEAEAEIAKRGKRVGSFEADVGLIMSGGGGANRYRTVVTA